MKVGLIGPPAAAASSPLLSHTPKLTLRLLIEFPSASITSSSLQRRKHSGKLKALEQPGGKMVVELVGAFNELTERMNELSTSSSRLLFKTLKLSLPILHSLPLLPDGRDPLSRALSLALFLAHLQVIPRLSLSFLFNYESSKLVLICNPVIEYTLK